MRVVMKKNIYRLIVLSLLSLLLSACGSSGGGSGNSEGASSNATSDECTGSCFENSNERLLVSDVEKVIAQGVAEAQSRNAAATIAVTDRVGNVLAVYRMANAQTTLTVATTTNQAVKGGLENLMLPAGADALAAIAKAVTGSYLSTEGNAFSTRTANQIVQENFNPGEENKPGGPLFGVQFSQLACSDFTGSETGSIGPQRSPLGLSADPGGFPLYKNGVPVGGVGVISDGLYSIDKNILNTDQDQDELIALAASFSYQAPVNRRADRITVDGKNFRFSDANNNDLLSALGSASFSNLTAADGSLIAVPAYISSATIRAGKRFGFADSGIRADTGTFAARDAFIFVDSTDNNRYPPVAGTATADLAMAAPLTAQEVTSLADQALAIANRARAQIRQPLSTQARVTISIVDTSGNVLAMVQTRDAPVFGADVSLQKARTAAFFSSPDAATFLNGLADTQYFNPDLSPTNTITIGDYVTAAQEFITPDTLDALTNGIAFSDRAGGNLSRPFYPDGIIANEHGPFSKPRGEWSPFSTGLQLDLVMNSIVGHIFHALAATPDVAKSCVNAPDLRIANGIQIFPGSVPIYRDSILVGGIGISGDGIDQDDMISFLGLHNTSQFENINNAPASMRADTLTPKGVRLRYVQCPQSPFIDSDEQNVCQGK